MKIADSSNLPLDDVFRRDPHNPKPKMRGYARRILQLTEPIDRAGPRTANKTTGPKKTKQKRPKKTKGKS